ncbi:MAG: hypothetical protein M9958_05250 [Chitinophagales bacterium]|nr:hypothetical protein [Chitinophagales bacterium]
MKPFLISMGILLAISSCQSSHQPKDDLKGTWKVIDYQNELLIPLSENELKGFEESVKIQKQKMLEFSEYTYSDSTYLYKHSPVDKDQGTWLMPNDTTLVMKSQMYRVTDTSNIHFTDAKHAVITMSDATQSIKVFIEKQ